MIKPLLTLATLLATVAVAKQVTLSKEPIPLDMPVGEEVRVEFPDTVINLNIAEPANSSIGDFLLKPDGTLLWTAKKPFKKSRVLATTTKGEVIVIDIKTGINADRTLTLVHPTAPTKPTEPEKKADPYELMPAFLKQQYQTGTEKPTKQYSYTDMAAFALQHYIGPSRLIEPLPATRIKPKSPAIRLIRVWNAELRFTLLNQWVLDKSYITAIKVKNVGSDPFHFDPRAIRGNYRFVASLHDVLPPLGSYQNETVWVFITDTPFHKAFQNPF